MPTNKYEREEAKKLCLMSKFFFQSQSSLGKSTWIHTSHSTILFSFIPSSWFSYEISNSDSRCKLSKDLTPTKTRIISRLRNDERKPNFHHPQILQTLDDEIFVFMYSVRRRTMKWNELLPPLRPPSLAKPSYVFYPFYVNILLLNYLLLQGVPINMGIQWRNRYLFK